MKRDYQHLMKFNSSQNNLATEREKGKERGEGGGVQERDEIKEKRAFISK